MELRFTPEQTDKILISAGYVMKLRFFVYGKEFFIGKLYTDFFNIGDLDFSKSSYFYNDRENDISGIIDFEYIFVKPDYPVNLDIIQNYADREFINKDKLLNEVLCERITNLFI